MNRFLFFILFLFIFNFANAQGKVSDDMLEDLPSKAEKKAETDTKSQKIKEVSPRAKKERRFQGDLDSKSLGNLPNYAMRTQAVTQFQSPTVVPKNNDFDQHIHLRRGDVLRALISQNIAVYPGSNAPVTAKVLEGRFKGALLLGEATMDRVTKRANISFNSIRPEKTKDTYSFTGDLMSDDGIKGLEGEYSSNYWTYFWAEAITNTVAGFAQATTKQTPTPWGTYAPEPSVENATRQGVAEGLVRTAEKFGDNKRTAPEITTISGPTIVKITVIK